MNIIVTLTVLNSFYSKKSEKIYFSVFLVRFKYLSEKLEENQQ